MREFKGRVIIPGTVRAVAMVSYQDFNTLASFPKALISGDRTVPCLDQNNKDIYRQKMAGKALCLPQTVGSTTGGMVLYCAAALGVNPACLLLSKSIDSIAAAGAVLTYIWTDVNMPTIDQLGDEFLNYVKSGMNIVVEDGGIVKVI